MLGAASGWRREQRRLCVLVRCSERDVYLDRWASWLVLGMQRVCVVLLRTSTGLWWWREVWACVECDFHAGYDYKNN